MRTADYVSEGLLRVVHHQIGLHAPTTHGSSSRGSTAGTSRRAFLRAATAASGTLLATLALPGVAAAAGRLAAGAADRQVGLRSIGNQAFVTVRDSDSQLIANRGSLGRAETFTIVDLGGGWVALRAANGMYVCAESAGQASLVANRPSPSTWESFRIITNADGSISLSSMANGGYVCSEGNGAFPLIANRSAIGPWEEFTLVSTGAVSAAPSRSSLIPGTYRPDRSTTGPLPGTTLRTVNGNLNVTAHGQVIENVEVWGSVNLGAYESVVIRNSVIHGTTATGKLTPCIIGAGENLRGLLIEDCRISGQGNPWCEGIRGGNYTIRRCELDNLPDAISLTSAIGNVTAEACWIHNGLYLEWDASTPNMPPAGGYYTHTDGVQFHRGSNYVFRGNMIGGVRVPGAHHTGLAAQIASGDDCYNSCFMIKQEVDGSVANRITNVLIEKNWLMGGAASINLASGRGNDFSSTVIRNNRFIRSTWGKQYYILRPPGLGVFENNVFDDTGQPVPISKGQ